ncbi:hypothetical protein HG530_013791 [Fusarium avenaceum]|nr:hypothetical protein HG530_013791 [Fusarium avenaceum]
MRAPFRPMALMAVFARLRMSRLISSPEPTNVVVSKTLKAISRSRPSIQAIRTVKGATHRAIWMAEPTATEIASSSLFLIATVTTVTYSAMFPTTGKIIKPISASDRPPSCVTSSIVLTRNSAFMDMRADENTRTATAATILLVLETCGLVAQIRRTPCASLSENESESSRAKNEKQIHKHAAQNGCLHNADVVVYQRNPAKLKSFKSNLENSQDDQFNEITKRNIQQGSNRVSRISSYTLRRLGQHDRQGYNGDSIGHENGQGIDLERMRRQTNRHENKQPIESRRDDGRADVAEKRKALVARAKVEASPLNRR